MGYEQFIRLDCRPIFNGEHRSFIYIDNICDRIPAFLDIGAHRDFFYIDWLYDQKCLLVEPTETSARELVQYINKVSFSEKFVSFDGLHPSKNSVSIHENGSMFPLKPLSVVKDALENDLIFCASTINLINNGLYKQSDIRVNAPCISPKDLISKYDIQPSFVKIDIEGGEFLIVKDLLSSTRPDFVQYEYGVPWFHADVTHHAMFDLMSDYYHYILTPRKMFLLESPLSQYFYANIIASRFYLGKEISY